MVPAIVYMTVAGFFRPIVFMALKKMKSDITFYRIPISKTYEAPTFTHPIPSEPKKTPCSQGKTVWSTISKCDAANIFAVCRCL